MSDFSCCAIYPLQLDGATDFFASKIPGVKSAVVRSQLQLAGQVSLDLARPNAAEALFGSSAFFDHLFGCEIIQCCFF